MNSETKAYRKARIIVKPECFTAVFNGDRLTHNHILALDQNNDMIPHTFIGEITEMRCDLTDEELSRIKAYDEGFLFYSNPHTCNFQHFLTELFPKVVDYLELVQGLNRAVPLLIPKYNYSKLVEDLLDALNLKPMVQLLDHGVHYFNNLYSSSFIPNFHAVHPRLLTAMKLLNRCAAEKYPAAADGSTARAGRTYLGRDKTASAAHNNNNAGGKRVLLNEEELLGILSGYGFDTTALGTCSVAEKKHLLENREVIISPIGANLMNFLFLSPPYPKLLLIIFSTSFQNTQYYTEILNYVYDRQICIGAFGGQALSQDGNAPYQIDLPYFESFLQNAFLQLHLPRT